jgi:hypothetical protein
MYRYQQMCGVEVFHVYNQPARLVTIFVRDFIALS